MAALFAAVDRVGMEAFGEVIRAGDATEATGLVRRALGL
jgi:hypothetical protein